MPVKRFAHPLLLLTLSAAVACSDETTPPEPSAAAATTTEAATAPGNGQERFLYVATIAQSSSDPDFIAVIGADPARPDFGTIVNRVDMPNVGDELHHFGYSADQRRLIVPGLFSNRIHVFEVGANPKNLRLRAVNDQLATASGYSTPHGIFATAKGDVFAPMIGAATGNTRPGGLVQVDDFTGAFVGTFGPGPERNPRDLGPRYMYDFSSRPDINRAISTTFGPPALCGPAIDPTCLGDEVAVWNLQRREVIQVKNLGKNSGALQVRFLAKHGTRRAFINTPGTNALWLAHDDDGNGFFEFRKVLGADDGLQLPADMLLSYDDKYLYLTNWFGNTVQQFDVSDPFRPVLESTVTVPHANMLRLSRDNKRLYVTNSLLSTWDNDAAFGPPRNQEYGIWLFQVNRRTGGLTPSTPGGRPWVSFTDVRKKNSTGPAGPHMMLFDPSIRLRAGEH